METIKLGSKGEAVKVLQVALNLTVDGDFGPKTDKAIKEFQKEHGLVVDGVVGPKTWSALGIIKSSDPRCLDESVIYKPLSVHVSHLKGRPIEYLAIHFTAGSNSKPGRAQGVYNTFVSRQASADFAVDDRDIVQFNPDLKNYYCWAVGDSKKSSRGGGKFYGKATNRNTISIEICSTCIPATQTAVSKSNHSGWSFTPQALDNAVRLSKMIMGKFGIPIEKVVRHYDITGKICPGIIGYNKEAIYEPNGTKTGRYSDESAWEEFKKRLL